MLEWLMADFMPTGSFFLSQCGARGKFRFLLYPAAHWCHGSPHNPLDVRHFLENS
jgi:hypothetical protein